MAAVSSVTRFRNAFMRKQLGSGETFKRRSIKFVTHNTSWLLILHNAWNWQHTLLPTTWLTVKPHQTNMHKNTSIIQKRTNRKINISNFGLFMTMLPWLGRCHSQFQLVRLAYLWHLHSKNNDNPIKVHHTSGHSVINKHSSKGNLLMTFSINLCLGCAVAQPKQLW